MGHMKPGKARKLLKCAGLFKEERRAYKTIAAMRKQYGVGYTGVNHGNRHIEWHDEKEDRDRAAKKMLQSSDMHPITKHIRYVLDPEETGDGTV